MEERKRRKCPLTPLEVGLMLRALGFSNKTYLYVASGEIYGGEETQRPLKRLFPNIYTKVILANQEIRPLLPFSSRLAAIDYIVCDESDVFVTNNNGNMAKILVGRRRCMGHKRTIRPNVNKLSALFMERGEMSRDTFARKLTSSQRMVDPEKVIYLQQMMSMMKFSRTREDTKDIHSSVISSDNFTGASKRFYMCTFLGCGNLFPLRLL